MPFIVVAVALVGGVLALIALMPLSLVVRYRAGTARRPARRWVAAINLVAVGISSALLLMVAGVTSYWIPMAFRCALMGFLGGCLLGILGLWLSRWEETLRSLHYTPSRMLVLAITLVVTARLLYGFWRSWPRLALHRGRRVLARGFRRRGLSGGRCPGARLLPDLLGRGLAAHPPASPQLALDGTKN